MPSKKKFPDVNMVLHPDMPQPSIGKMVQVASLVHLVNSFEPKMNGLSDTELKGQTARFKDAYSQISQRL